MEKQSSDFFGLARVSAGRGGLAIWAASLVIPAAVMHAGVGLSVAQAQATPSPQVEQSAEELALLPSIELTARPALKGAVRIGDRVELGISDSSALAGGQQPTKLKLQLPLADEIDDAGVEILPAQSGSHRINVTPIKAGQVVVPPLIVRDESGTAVARTQPFTITVTSSVKPGETPPPLRPPVRVEFPAVLAVLLGALTLAVFAVLAVMAARWIKSATKARTAPALPPLPEDERALRALEAIEQEKLMEKGLHKKHYFGVSEALKNYIGRRYHFDAPERTSREIIEELRAGKEQSHELTSKLEALFNRLDLVKFTDHLPEQEQGREVLDEARKFVLTTRRPVTASQPVKAEHAIQ